MLYDPDYLVSDASVPDGQLQLTVFVEPVKRKSPATFAELFLRTFDTTLLMDVFCVLLATLKYKPFVLLSMYGILTESLVLLICAILNVALEVRAASFAKDLPLYPLQAMWGHIIFRRTMGESLLGFVIVIIIV